MNTSLLVFGIIYSILGLGLFILILKFKLISGKLGEMLLELVLAADVLYFTLVGIASITKWYNSKEIYDSMNTSSSTYVEYTGEIYLVEKFDPVSGVIEVSNYYDESSKKMLYFCKTDLHLVKLKSINK